MPSSSTLPYANTVSNGTASVFVTEYLGGIVRVATSILGGKVTFENFSTFTMNTPVPPKNIIPREPSFWEGAWDTVKTLGPWAFFGYALGSGGLANHPGTTVNNAPATP